MRIPPKHQQIADELLAEIREGKHDDEQRFPSEAQLVKRFAVSRPTIVHALQALKARGVLERRAGSGTYLCEDKETKAAPQQLGLIGPILRKVDFFETISGELASLARVHGFVLHWGGSTRPRGNDEVSIQDSLELCDQYIEAGISGVFFYPFEHTPANEPANRYVTERLSKAGIPVVLLDRDICPFPHRSEFDLVGMDNFAGGYLIAEHLIKLGARKLVFVSRPYSATTLDARLAGAKAAMERHGIPVARDFLHLGECTEKKFVRQLTAGHPYDAVICINDLTAAQLLQTLAHLAINTPLQLRIVGFDDARFAALLTLPLTTMQQPCRDIAIAAFSAMRERLSNPTTPARNQLLTPRLVIRESCGAYTKIQK